jgi:hypothetical protein
LRSGKRGGIVEWSGLGLVAYRVGVPHRDVVKHFYTGDGKLTIVEVQVLYRTIILFPGSWQILNPLIFFHYEFCSLVAFPLMTKAYQVVRLLGKLSEPAAVK